MKSYSFPEYLFKVAAITLAVGGLIAVLLALAKVLEAEDEME